MNEKYEYACWSLITKEPYQDKLATGNKVFVVDFWESHYSIILDRKHVIQHRIAKIEYVEHAKKIVEMREVEVFEEF